MFHAIYTRRDCVPQPLYQIQVRSPDQLSRSDPYTHSRLSQSATAVARAAKWSNFRFGSPAALELINIVLRRRLDSIELSTCPTQHRERTADSWADAYGAPAAPRLGHGEVGIIN